MAILCPRQRSRFLRHTIPEVASTLNARPWDSGVVNEQSGVRGLDEAWEVHDTRGQDALVDRLASELLRVRRRRFDSDAFRDAAELHNLSLVRHQAEMMQSGLADAAKDEVLATIETADNIRLRAALLMFFGVTTESSALTLEARNAHVAQLLHESSDRWRRRETHLALMRELARLLLRKTALQRANSDRSESADTSRVPPRSAPRPINVDMSRIPPCRLSLLSSERLPHLIDRAVHDFLMGIFEPFRGNASSIATGQEALSLYGLAKLIYFAKVPTAALQPDVRYFLRVELQLGGSEDPIDPEEQPEKTHLYVYVFDALPAMHDEHVRYSIRTPAFSDYALSCLRVAVERAGLNEPAAFHAILKDLSAPIGLGWREWLESCSCPSVTEQRSVPTQIVVQYMFDANCDVHSNYLRYFSGHSMYVQRYFWVVED